MVKAYLRYVQSHAFGVVASHHSNCVFDSSGTMVVSGANESVVVWNHKLGTQVSMMQPESTGILVTCIARSPDGEHIAAGYADGSLKIWNAVSGSLKVSMNGHRTGISSLRYNKDGSLLASGSRDTNIVVWDIVGETGLYRLQGHKDMVTDVAFVETYNGLISSSKDQLVKVWDLETSSCIQTVVGHRGEVWSLDLSDDEKTVLTGSTDNQIRIYSLGPTTTDPSDGVAEASDISVASFKLEHVGALFRQSSERVGRLRIDPSQQVVACHGADKSIEVWKIASQEEMKKKLRRKRKKSKEKMENQENGEAGGSTEAQLTPSDSFTPLGVVRCPSKVRSFDFASISKGQMVQMLASLHNNSVELYTISINENEFRKVSSLENEGHRTDIRSISLSSDDGMILTTSTNSIKIWSKHTQQCVRTMDSGYALCSLFVPGDRHVLVGTKSGELELYDIASATMIESVAAHTGPIWSLALRPDGNGFASGSADHEVKFWDFELIADEQDPQMKRLTVTHTRTLKMAEDVMCVRFSPNSKLVLVALLDCTVKVFYEDSLKFFLSLYGHKLPVMSMDVSSDSTLLATASADKNVKIWGLDFGDCHKSIFSHDESVMQVCFVPRTHYYFTAGKDRLVKYWDGDTFEHISTLSGHHAEVWCLAMGKKGTFLVTASRDKSLRIWNKTDEQLFLEEEREKELEEVFEKKVEDEGAAGGALDATTVTSKRTIETLKAGEAIMEALKMADTEKKTMEMYRAELAEMEAKATPQQLADCKKTGKPLLMPPTPNILLLGMQPDDYVLKVLTKVRSADVEEALLVLSFDDVLQLLALCDTWMNEGKEVELVSRCIFFLLRVHQNQIISTGAGYDVLQRLKISSKDRLQSRKDLIGYNLAAMSYLKRELEINSEAKFFDVDQIMQDAAERKSERKRKKISPVV